LWRGDARLYKRIVLKENSWDGDDIFWPRGGPCVIVSERFKSAYLRHDLLGLEFKSLKDQWYDYYPAERPKLRVLEFEETMKVLQSRNTDGHLDQFLEAMKEMREQVVADPQFEWWVAMRQLCTYKTAEIADAMSEAHYNIARGPWPFD
jgi:hypothetical protein